MEKKTNHMIVALLLIGRPYQHPADISDVLARKRFSWPLKVVFYRVRYDSGKKKKDEKPAYRPVKIHYSIYSAHIPSQRLMGVGAGPHANYGLIKTSDHTQTSGIRLPRRAGGPF